MTALPESPPRPDTELVAAWRAGDQRAATALVERHAQAVGRYLFSAGARAEDLDDLVQETFIRAFRAMAGWRGESALRSWLFTIAGNLLRDDYRRRKGRQFVPIEDRDLAAPGDPEGELAADDAAERLQAGLARLPRLQREVFLMRVQGGEDYAAIAAALGTTPGAARVHYHHAVKRLKECLA